MSNTMTGRLALAMLAAALLNAGMFSVLWQLTSGPLGEEVLMRATRIDFTRMRRDTEVASKRDERVEREPPPAVPELPRLSVNVSGVRSNIAPLAPVVDARSAMLKMSMTAGSDRDVIPLVRINPDYPRRALNQNIEGWVIVQFTITATGAVRDAVVIEADPKNTFDEAALKAIARWRYNPKVEAGVAVERVGVRTVIRFEIEE